jgi:hypothetical protein
MMNEIPVLFPRTAMRQSILYKYSWVGESCTENDIREAKTKLTKILLNYQVYKNALTDCSGEIIKAHGLDFYAGELQLFYETAFAKRRRFKT